MDFSPPKKRKIPKRIIYHDNAALRPEKTKIKVEKLNKINKIKFKITPQEKK